MFGPYRLEIGEARLSHEGRLVALRPKAFAVLSMLASQPGALVTKDELLDAVWGQRFITEGVIKSIVTDLRQALDDNPNGSPSRWGLRNETNAAMASGGSSSLRWRGDPLQQVAHEAVVVDDEHCRVLLQSCFRTMTVTG